MAWLDGWNYRVKIEIQDTHLDGDETDFRLLVPIRNHAGIGEHASLDGTDLRFTDSDGTTLLPFERETFAIADGQASGICWVKVPLVTSGAYIYLYCGNAEATEASSPTAVWGPAEYCGVWHMSAESNQVADRSGNGNDLSYSSGTVTDATGKISGALQFSSGCYARSINATLKPNQFTLSCWYNQSQADGMGHIFCISYHGSYWGSPDAALSAGCHTGKPRLALVTGGSSWNFAAPTATTPGEWHHLVATYDLETFRLYVDGVQVDSLPVSGNTDYGYATQISIARAVPNGQTEYFQGIVDELQFSSVPRSAAWIKFSYYNQSSETSELVWGEMETPGSGGSGGGEIGNVRTWQGGCQARQQITHVRFENVEVGDTFTLTINRKDVAVTATEASAQNVVDQFVEAISISNVAEFYEWNKYEAAIDTDGTPILKLTGPSNGKPITITGSTSDAWDFSVQAIELQAGRPAINEKQQITLPTGTIGGTYTLSFGGQTTTGIAYDAAASTVQSALEALPTIGAENVGVTGDAGGPWVVEFKGDFAAIDVPLLEGNGESLTGTFPITAEEIVKGRLSNEKWRFSTTDGGPQWYLHIKLPWNPGQYTPMLHATATAAQVQAALETLDRINPGDVIVTRTDDTGYPHAVHRFEIEWTGQYAGVNMDDAASYYAQQPDFFPIYMNVTPAGAEENIPEVQDITIPIASGGTYTLAYYAQTTAAIAYNADAAAIQSALQDLSAIGEGNVTVALHATDSQHKIYRVTFAGSLAGSDQPLIIGDGADLSGGALAVDLTQLSQTPRNERQQILLTNNPHGGTFALRFPGAAADTAAIARAAAAEDIQSALEALAEVEAGDVVVTGDAGGPWIVEYQGSYAATNIALMTGDASNLTGLGNQSITITEVVTPTGPNWFDNPENWAENAVPADGNEIVFEYGDVDCLYGLEQEAITPASLRITAGYGGRIGLPPYNGDYWEYRPQYLRLGNAAAGTSMAISIGYGDGTGSSRLRIDTGDCPAVIEVYGTGVPEDDTLAALAWKGTAAGNALWINKGTVGIAPFAAEEAVLQSLTVGYVASKESDVLLSAGDRVAIGAIVKTGGEVRIGGKSGSAISSIVHSGGLLTIDGTDGVEQLTLRGGVVRYNSTGPLGGNTIVSGDGVLDFSRNLQARTVTNPIEMYGEESEVLDPHQVVAGLILDMNETTRISALGTHVRLTRGTPA